MRERPAVLVLLDESLLEDARSLEAELQSRLPGTEVEVATDPPADAAGVAVAVTWAFDDSLLADASDLKWVHALTAGVDHYPVEALRDAGVALTNASGVHAEPIAEQVLGYLLCFERNLHRGIRQQARGEWDRYGGHELRGKTVGIVGLGAIGGRTAELASALGTTVVGTKRTPADAPDDVDEVFAPSGLPTVLEQSDYVVLTCPLTDDTRGLIDREAIATMREDAVLVNVARGEIVDGDALVAAVRDGEIRGAALDVFCEEPLPTDSPLWDMDEVILTPHMAGSTPAYWARNADIVAANYERLLDGDLDGFENRVV